jgi:hypothetical protein
MLDAICSQICPSLYIQLHNGATQLRLRCLIALNRHWLRLPVKIIYSTEVVIHAVKLSHSWFDKLTTNGLT